MTATIKKQFMEDDGARESFMSSARDCAVLSKPGVLPRENRSNDSPLEKPYQNTGGRGTENIVGKLMTSGFPPGFPWFAHKLSAKVRKNLKREPERAKRRQSELYERDRDLMAHIELTRFREPMRRVLRNWLVVGNFLFQVVPKTYKIKNYRLDNWTVRRTGDGTVLRTIAREKIDPLSMPKKKQIKSDLNIADLKNKTPTERLETLYTRSMWNPVTKMWVMEEEVNDKIVLEKKQKVNQFIVGGFEDIGEDYFEGFIEQVKAELTGLNGLSRSRNEISAEMGRVNMVNDPRSNIRSRKLENARQGEVLSGRVNDDGTVKGIGHIQSDKNADLQGVMSAMKDLKGDLSKNMLMELDQQPKGDRVTATQIMRIAQELDGGQGGLYSAFADQIQFPLITLYEFMMLEDNLLELIDPRTVDVEIMTGFAALAREIEIEKKLKTVQILASLGDVVTGSLKGPSIGRDIIELSGQNPDDFVKSEEETAQEKQDEDARLLRLKAGGQAVESLGKIAEQTSQANNAA